MQSSKITLDPEQIHAFVKDGFIRISGAFSKDLAREARQILWHDTNCAKNNPSSWRAPVIRLGQYGQEPFRSAANAPILLSAYDQLTGAGQWLAPQALGTFVIRFPSREEPDDTGWHVDASFGNESPDFLDWRINIRSRGRALLMLFLFSDVGADDAPTRIRRGSHRDVARRLAPAGEAGLSLRDLVASEFLDDAGNGEILATGSAGTVYLCHPFLVHAAQPNRTGTPRFLAQPPLLWRKELAGHHDETDVPVYQAIREALKATA